MLRVHTGDRNLQDTLDMISNQTVPTKVYAFACEPTQDLRAQLHPYVEHIYTISQETYDRWSFLNRSMEMTDTPQVVFLDSECTPVDVHWLAMLLEPCRKQEAGAAFSRLMPRSDAHPMIMHDLSRTFDHHGRSQAGMQRHIFSQYAFVCSRSVWEEQGFQDSLGAWAGYVWSWNLRRSGTPVVYAHHSRVLFNESYAPGSLWHRSREEGRVEAELFSWEPKEISLRNYVLSPWARHIRGDWSLSVSQRNVSGVFASPLIRSIQYIGKCTAFRRAYRKRS